MHELDLHQAQAISAQLDVWYEAIGLEQSSEMKFAKLTEEVIEARIAHDEYTDMQTPHKRAELAGELADVLFTTISLMNNYGIDANEALHQVFTKNKIGRAHV